MLTPGMQRIISPDALNVSVDSVLRRFVPDLPFSPQYVREHGVMDAIQASMGPHRLNIDVGNLERGTPLVTDPALWGTTQPPRDVRGEMTGLLMNKLSHCGSCKSDRANKNKISGKPNSVGSSKLLEKLKKMMVSKEKRGAFQLSTLKNVMRALRAEAPQGLNTTRKFLKYFPGPHYVPSNALGIAEQFLPGIRSQVKGIKENTVNIPRLHTRGAKQWLKALKMELPKSVEISKNIPMVALHETGHAATSKRMEALLQAATNRSIRANAAQGLPKLNQKAMKASYIAQLKATETPKGLGAYKVPLLLERTANQRVLKHMMTYGSPKEVEEWVTLANRQMNENYRKPLLRQTITGKLLLRNLIKNKSYDFSEPGLRETINEIKSLPIYRKGGPLTTLRLPSNG